MRKIKIPIWYMLLTAAVCAALIYFGMIRWQIRLSSGVFIDMNQFIHPFRLNFEMPDQSVLHNFTNLSGGAVCLFMGLVCFVLGIIRAVNRLHCKQILLIALFSILFSLARLSAAGHDFGYIDFQPADYLYRIAFYVYPIPLFLHFYHYLRPSFKKWMFSPVVVIMVYGAAVWLMYFYFDLPLDIPHGMYTPISAACAVVLLIAGIFGAESKESARYLRIIAAWWVAWLIYILIKTGAGTHFIIDSDYNVTMMLCAVFMTCYMLFVNTRELVGYKSGMQMMEMKNEFLMENYQALENHFSQITQMKHEMRHHLFAIRTLHENGETGQLAKYLTDIQDSFAEIEEPVACGNRIVQAVLSHAAQFARRLDFEIRFDVLPLPILSVSDADMVSLFMNLLNNALESCEKIQDPKQRWVTVTLMTKASYVYISVVNARHGAVSMDGERYVSTKNTSVPHGQGIVIINKIAEKHGGFTEFEHTENTFSAEVALPVD